MLRYFLTAAVALVFVAGATLAQDEKKSGDEKKAKAADTKKSAAGGKKKIQTGGSERDVDERGKALEDKVWLRPGRYVGALVSVDADKGTISVRLAGRADKPLIVEVPTDAKVLGADGKDLKDGLKNDRFKQKANVAIVRGPGGKVKELRVGAPREIEIKGFKSKKSKEGS